MEKVRLSFSYPETLKDKLQALIENKKGWKLQGYIKHILLLKIQQLKQKGE